MWVRVFAKLLALVGLYSIVVTRMSNQSGFTETAGMVEVAAVTVGFVIIAVLVLAWRPRAKPPVEPPVE
jgi:hypothetical protein